jgi:hypothetical protein
MQSVCVFALSLGVLERVPDMQTDFAVAEECNRWGECDDYRTVYGDRVFVIEYRQQDFDAGCSAYPGLSIVLRDLDSLDTVERFVRLRRLLTLTER